MTETAPPTKADGANDNNDGNKLPATKEKLRSIMEAASALTALGDEESETSRPTSPSKEVTADEPAKEATAETSSPSHETMTADEVAASNAKRYLPEHKKPDAAPTFPEKMMALMRYADEQGKDNTDFCVAWMPEGKSFVIRNPDEFARQVVPRFFKATKFSSFTRKLYRWGFRQINRGIGPDDPIIFGNEFFDRDNEELMSKMKSVTAAGTRKSDSRGMGYGKRPFEGMYDGDADQKRFLFDHLMQQKTANLMHQNASLYGGMSTNGTMPLSNSLRPAGMGMDQGHHQQMMAMNKPYEMMPQGGAAAAMMNNQYNPMHHQHQQQHQQQQQQLQQQGMGAPNNVGNGQGYGGNSQSTAEIVNAAIRALQFSS